MEKVNLYKKASDFLDALSLRNECFTGKFRNYIFRGQSNSKWPVVPSALRKGTSIITEYGPKKTILHTVREQILAEYFSIIYFCQALNRNGLFNPNEDILNIFSSPDWVSIYNKLGRSEKIWPPKELHSTIALAQHYGIPTRFTDWTYNPLVAAYFAAKDNLIKKLRKEKHGEYISVYAIDSGEACLRGFNFKDEGMKPSSAFIQESSRFYQIVKSPSYFNENIRAQRGVFLAYIEKDFYANAKCVPLSLRQYTNRMKVNSFYELRMHHSKCPQLLRLLAREFIDAGVVFPGVKGAAESILEQRMWDSHAINI